jgi:hypothetical protein
MNQEERHIDSSVEHLKEIARWISSVLDVNQVLELIVEKDTRDVKGDVGSKTTWQNRLKD